KHDDANYILNSLKSIFEKYDLELEVLNQSDASNITDINSKGYKIFYVSDNGEELSFIQR
ncbi:MAG: hypothetical protein RRY25_09750, partial [Anaerovorax sp.]